jgi:tetratricopeptide (TPR) repeat protein
MADSATLKNAVIALHAGRLADADRLCRKALRAAPDDEHALHMLGIVQLQSGHPGRAMGFLEPALRGRAVPSQLYNNHATALNALRRPEEALASLDRAISLAPNDAGLHYNRGNTLMVLLRNEESLAAFRRALELAPNMSQAWQNRSIVEIRLGLGEDALASSDRLVALSPGDAAAREARGEALLSLERPAEAIAEFEAAAANAGTAAIAYLNKAHALNVTGRIEEALDAIDIALREDPNYAQAHFNAGCMRLSVGDYARGWQEYEWRWRKPDSLAHVRPFTQPLWVGQEDVRGATVLLHAEQGFGDSVQFCRYAPMLAERGARVVLEVPKQLIALMRTLAGVNELVARGEKLPEFHFHCPLMSLPLAFGTLVDSIPWNGPYLSADPERRAIWRERLGPARKPRIGLAWSGTSAFAGDAFRSARLESWRGLILPEFDYVCVQKDIRPADAAVAAELGIAMFGELINDFGDAAALSEAMDLVISVDSAPAHVAGALGQRLWVMLPFNPEWRWMRSGDRTAWYPTARLFRQTTQLDWESIAARVGAALRGEMG